MTRPAILLMAAFVMLAGSGCKRTVEPMDDGSGPECNVLTNSGCKEEQKCGQRIDSLAPFSATITCLPEGTVELGQPCIIGTVGEDGGWDNCTGGNACLDDICTEVCTLNPNSCPPDHSCVPFNNVFDDVPSLGLCQRSCDPLTPNCADAAHACYVTLTTGASSCLPPTAPEGQVDPLGQGESCALLNSCAAGYGCLLVSPDLSETTCGYFCDTTGAGPGCGDAGGPGASYECVQLNLFYGDVSSSIPDSLGVCAECDDFPGNTACQ